VWPKIVLAVLGVVLILTGMCEVYRHGSSLGPDFLEVDGLCMAFTITMVYRPEGVNSPLAQSQ
jgi:hypothetical protein